MLCECTCLTGHALNAPTGPNPINYLDVFCRVRQIEPLAPLQRRDLLRQSVPSRHQWSQHPQRNDDHYDRKLHIAILLLEFLADKKFQAVRPRNKSDGLFTQASGCGDFSNRWSLGIGLIWNGVRPGIDQLGADAGVFRPTGSGVSVQRE